MANTIHCPSCGYEKDISDTSPRCPMCNCRFPEVVVEDLPHRKKNPKKSS